MLQDIRNIIKHKSLTARAGQQKSWQEQMILAYLEQQGKNNPSLSFLIPENIEVSLHSSSLIVCVQSHMYAQTLAFYTSAFQNDLAVKIGAPITRITVVTK